MDIFTLRSPEQERNTSWSQRERPDGRAMEEGGGVGGGMDGRFFQLQVKAERFHVCRTTV